MQGGLSEHIDARHCNINMLKLITHAIYLHGFVKEVGVGGLKAQSLVPGLLHLVCAWSRIIIMNLDSLGHFLLLEAHSQRRVVVPCSKLQSL